MKIIIIGYSGSGKTTLATELSEKLGYIVFHVDDIMYNAGNQCKAEDAMRAMESYMDMCREDEWIIDGYRWQCIKEEWMAETDLIIFLNIGKWTCFWSALMRYIKSYACGIIKRIKRYMAHNVENVESPHKDGNKTVGKEQRHISFDSKSFQYIYDKLKKTIWHLCYIIRVEHIRENERYYMKIGEHYPEKFIVLKSRKEVERFLEAALNQKNKKSTD